MNLLYIHKALSLCISNVKQTQNKEDKNKRNNEPIFGKQIEMLSYPPVVVWLFVDNSLHMRTSFEKYLYQT